MKKIVRLVGSSVLAGSMLLGMTGCALTDVKNAGTEIMSNSLNFKGSKVTKYFNEDDDDYDVQCELFEQYMDNMAEFLDMDYDEVVVKSYHIDVKNNDATIEYVYEIEDETFEYELNLTKDGDDWVIEDNEEFITSTWQLYFEIADEISGKSVRSELEDMKDYYGCDDYEELAEAFYDYSMDAIAFYGDL